MAHHHRSVSGSSSSSGLHFPGSSPFGDTTFTKVFVGGLAWETNSDALRRHFEPFGEIFEAAVISDKNTGRSKGYGFVGPSFPFFFSFWDEKKNQIFDLNFSFSVLYLVPFRLPFAIRSQRGGHARTLAQSSMAGGPIAIWHPCGLV